MEARNPDAAVETIRVGVNLLDRLMSLVGELVLARNQVLQFSSMAAGFRLPSGVSKHEPGRHGITGRGMKTRMQPIAAGATVFVPDEVTSVLWGMAGLVARAGLADKIPPLDQVAHRIIRATTHQVAAQQLLISSW